MQHLLLNLKSLDFKFKCYWTKLAGTCAQFFNYSCFIKLNCNTFFKFGQKTETERPHANNKQQLLNVFPGVNRLMRVAEREQDINRRRRMDKEKECAQFDNPAILKMG